MLLGIVCIIAGFFIAFDFFIQWEPRLDKISNLIEKYAKYMGMVAIFFGLWKFFGPDATESINPYVASNGTAVILESQPFIGDFFPAIFVFFGGFSLFPQMLNFFNIEDSTKEKFSQILEKLKLVVGLGNILLGLIHLLIPGTTLF